MLKNKQKTNKEINQNMLLKRCISNIENYTYIDWHYNRFTQKNHTRHYTNCLGSNNCCIAYSSRSCY